MHILYVYIYSRKKLMRLIIYINIIAYACEDPADTVPIEARGWIIIGGETTLLDPKGAFSYQIDVICPIEVVAIQVLGISHDIKYTTDEMGSKKNDKNQFEDA